MLEKYRIFAKKESKKGVKMTTLQLNNELQRQLSYISDDAILLKKAINYIKQLGKERHAAYAQEDLNADIDKLLTVFHVENITQEEFNHECEMVRREQFSKKTAKCIY